VPPLAAQVVGLIEDRSDPLLNFDGFEAGVRHIQCADNL
jgi:hypothetical protein